jgi:hypothetical protein
MIKCASLACGSKGNSLLHAIFDNHNFHVDLGISYRQALSTASAGMQSYPLSNQRSVYHHEPN